MNAHNGFSAGNFIELFDQLSRSDLNEPGWLASLRKSALEQFARTGLPTHDERWRTTNLKQLATATFGFSTTHELTDEQFAKTDGFVNTNEVRLAFVNGVFSKRFSSITPDIAGVQLVNLMQAAKRDPALVSSELRRHTPTDEDPFIALNTAFFEDGAFVRIAPNTNFTTTIHILHLTVGNNEDPILTSPRTLILAGKNSRATILETHIGVEGAYLTNALTEIVLDENATVDHYKLENETAAAFSISSIRAHLAQSSNFSNHAILIGGKLVRNDVGAILDGEEIDCVLNGLYLARDSQHMDTHTSIQHAKPHCHSRETYKGILDDSATGVFSGRIHVHPDAQRTDAIQSNRALLLSDRATVNTQPQLKIYADDVRCTHGAAVGRVDEEAIFYLRSRGIGAEDALGILNYAFANEIIDAIRIPALKRKLESLVAVRFRKDLAAA